MAYKFQLADAKASALKDIAAVCPDSAKFTSLVNEAQEIILRRGNWENTECLVRLCLHDRCLTLPRYVETVLGARLCDGNTVEIQNNWFSITQSGRYGTRLGGLFTCDFVMSDRGTAPTYRRIGSADGLLIRYYVRNRPDIGKTITIYGKGVGGQPLQTRDSAGNWTPGIVLTAAAPFVSSTVLVTEITSVVRQATQGMSYLYEYDSANDILRDLAFYEPNETNPRYRQMVLGNWCSLQGCTDDNGVRRVQVELLVKLAFIPVTSDYDFLLIDNWSALKYAVQAVRAHEANDDALGVAKTRLAINEMNAEMRNQFPSEATPVKYESIGGVCYSPI